MIRQTETGPYSITFVLYCITSFYSIFMLKHRNSLHRIKKQCFPDAYVSFVFTVPYRLNCF